MTDASPADPQAGAVRVVIVNYKTAPLTIRCLASLEPERAAVPGLRVSVVENASGEAATLADAIRDRGWGGWVDLIAAEKNGGFSYGNNRGIAPALRSDRPPRFVYLLNSDTEVEPGAVRALVDFMDTHPEAGIAGSALVNPDGSDWPLAFRFPSIWSELDEGLKLGVVSRLLRDHGVVRRMPQDRPAPVDWVSGASLIVRREVFDAVGLMDEGYFLYYEEVDLCLRARRAGWRCWYVPAARVMHVGSQSTGVESAIGRPKRRPAYWFASRHRYFAKNHGRLYALLADLAFGLGFATWRLRRLLQRKPDRDPPRFLADFWRHAVLLNLSGRPR